MESNTNPAPLIVILGQTASGKSALALKLAERFGGEIICADSRTIYKGMNIGTAKPTADDQRLIPHHLLNIVSPDERFSAAQFQALAFKKIDEISARGKIPFLVGGSGLYIDAIIYDFTFRPQAEPAERARLESLTVSQLQAELRQKDLPLPANNQNKRHLIRTLETGGASSTRRKLRPNTLVLGIEVEQNLLKNRIYSRVEQMVRSGFVDEVSQLASRYGWDAPGLQAPGYRAFRLYLEGRHTLEQTSQLFAREHLHYAKRQKTWFKRNHDIHWISNSEDSVDLITTFLNK